MGASKPAGAMGEVEELRYLILALQREGNRLLAAELRPLGVTPAQAEVLTVLRDRQPLTLAGLGELLVCETGGSPSRLVDRLVGQGLVRRDESAQDRRFVTLSLTAQGRTAAERITDVEQNLHDRLADLAGGLPMTSTLRLLRRMTATFPAGKAVRRRATIA